MAAANGAYVVAFDLHAGGKVRVLQNHVRMTQRRHYIRTVAAPVAREKHPHNTKHVQEMQNSNGKQNQRYRTPYHILNFIKTYSTAESELSLVSSARTSHA